MGKKYRGLRVVAVGIVLFGAVSCAVLYYRMARLENDTNTFLREVAHAINSGDALTLAAPGIDAISLQHLREAQEIGGIYENRPAPSMSAIGDTGNISLYVLNGKNDAHFFVGITPSRTGWLSVTHHITWFRISRNNENVEMPPGY